MSNQQPPFATPTPTTVGKIMAIHISYAARAEERGRTPKQPSYFLKPASSVGASDGSVERPAGTELLAFEGEIALVIGRTAKNVSVTDAWSYVEAVTAANDFGLYDLRTADKGSNLRSKGRDGFTPLGPQCIPAAYLDPTAIRIRTWVNDKLRQDDSTATLLFTLPRMVADLSQHLTLNPGDVILTGTPAGASVANPGDVIEIEVDAPTAADSPSTGRLRTTVTQGTIPFDGAIGELPTIDDLQRIEAWGSPAAAGLEEATTASALTAQVRKLLEATPTAGLSAQLRKRGINASVIEGVSSINAGTKLVGTAKTLRFVPGREDLFVSHGGGYNAQKRAFDEVKPGEVIVIEARGESGSGTMGDILAIRAKDRGAAGVVTDGGVRDYDTVGEIGLPVFTRGPHPAVLGRKHVPWDIDITIACGGATVQPGDVIVGDGDGVIVIPANIVAEVADAAAKQEHEDEWIAAQVAAGNKLDGLFPPNANWRSRYEAETATSTEQTNP